MWPRPLAVFALLTTAWSVPAAADVRVPLQEAARRAEVVAVVQIADPGVDQVAVPGSGEGVSAYVRHRFRVVVVDIVRAGRTALPLGQPLLVDQHGWRADLAEHLRCKGKDCRWPEKPMLDTQLSREPRPGQRALALLTRTADGWQLACALGFDRPERAALLTPSRGTK